MGGFDSRMLEQRNYLGFVVFTSERSLSLPNCVVNTSILIFRGTPSTFHIQIPNIDSKYQIQKLDPCKAQIVSLRFQYRCGVRWDGAGGDRGDCLHLDKVPEDWWHTSPQSSFRYFQFFVQNHFFASLPKDTKDTL